MSKTSKSRPESPIYWGILRRQNLSKWIVVVLVLIQLVDEKCLVVEGLPVEVEGEFSPLSADTDRSTNRMAMELLEAAEKSEGAIQEKPRETQPSSSLPRNQAVKLLLQKFKQIEKAVEREEIEEELERSASEAGLGRTENARAIWMEDYDRKASELCGTKASLECGKRVLSLIEGEESDLDVHMKCDLRDDFLKCIDMEKKICLDMAQNAMLPDLPSKEVIKKEQSKLWKVLWTAGGCVLAN